MTSTDPGTPQAQPRDPALFAPLSLDENRILQTHLTSGWYKQSAVYPPRPDPCQEVTGLWQDTCGLLDDLHAAWRTTYDASQAATRAGVTDPEPDAELPEPETGA